MRKLKIRFNGRLIGAVLCLLGIAFLSINMLNMYRYLHEQVKNMGEINLREISDDMQHTLEKSKTSLLKFSSDVEVYMALDTGYDELEKYLKNQSKIFRDKSEDTLMNAYICTEDRILISDSAMPENYVVTERDWYRSTRRNGIDNIYTSAPYQDAFTGDMCFTLSILLHDGKTIVAMDFNLSPIQNSMERMNRDLGGESLIVSREGIVVGYTESGYLGKKLDDVLPEYTNVFKSIVNGENDSLFISTSIGGRKNTSFCDRSGDWFFVYTVDNDSLYSEMNRIMLLNFLPRIIMIIGVFAYYLYVCRINRIVKAERELYAPDEIKDVNAEEINAETGEITKYTKKSRNKIMTILVITSLVAFVFTGTILVNWGNDRMERNVDSYSYQLEEWMNTQLQTLNMFVDTIAANPSVLDDYDYAVEYLDKIVKKYPEISAAYIARPGNEHEMTMNNGWVPNADYVVAERQWYMDTENSEDGMSVSSPYLDARTGLYCMTFSRKVFDAETNEQIGIFALDFYIENLTSIMEASYSDDGYAFLVDNSDLIVNHPHTAYQISSEKSVNISGTEYRGVKNSPGVHFIRDYDGNFKVCIYHTEEATGFSVIAVKNVLSVYGIVTLCGGVFIALLIACIILLYRMIIKMMKWQEKSRIALIKEAKRASQADHAKSSFLAQMSHEIRTPINAVLGMNEMILRESKEENTLNYASNAYNAGNALLSIINDILDISKIEAGKLEINETEYDLYSLISNCYHMTANRADKKGLEFRVICDEKMPSKLKGDMFHIRQIAVNMITNAVKYTDNGFVELNFSGVENEDGFAVSISVRDSGIGLKPENLEKLFDSFQRFDLEHNQTIEGTGLGLSICKRLAELMNGSIRAESVYGEGSTFICVIPQQVVNDAPIGSIRLDCPAEKIEVEGKNMFIAPDARILAVDDVDMNLLVLNNFLKIHKMRIDTALSGKQSLELVSANTYDMIFMDHMMPEMDGIETFKKMREMGHLDPDTRVVMLTANAILGEEEKYLAMGFDSYLTKPVQSQKLDEMLLKFLPKEKVIFTEEKSAQEKKEDIQPETPENEIFDINTGMVYNGNDKKIYYKVMQMYVSSGNEKMERICELLKAESWKDYITEVHALKSTSLMIGSKKLSEAAKELEFAGREENYELIKEKNESLIKLYKQVIDIVNDFLVKEGVSPAVRITRSQIDKPMPEISAEKLKEYISQFADACDKFEYDEAVRVYDEISGYSFKKVSLASYFSEAKKCIENFELDEAAEKAGKIFDELCGG